MKRAGKRRRKKNSRLSLAPVKLEDALQALLKTASRRKNALRKPVRPMRQLGL